MLFAVSRAWDKEKILSLYEESNLRPSDSEPQCSAKGLLRFKSLRVHSVFPSSCALDQTNHVLFLLLNILYRDVMLFWSFFDQVRCGLHICFAFFFFFLLSQRLLNCPRHGEFSPNGIDLSKEWHFLFYFVQIFYTLPAHKSRIYIT